MTSTLICHIHNLGVFYISQIQVAIDPLFQYPIWICLKDLGLYGELVEVWDRYIQNIIMVGITLYGMKDKFTQAGKTIQEHILVKDSYKFITKPQHLEGRYGWFNNIWPWNLPLKLKCFGWLTWQNKIQTRDNFCQWGFTGLSRCILCLRALEDVAYIFLTCPFSVSIWAGFLNI